MVIIREIFDGANELFENELEHALDIGCQTIVIEPCRLGEETARWIMVGNTLLKASIITGIGSIASGLLFPNRPAAQFSLLTTSLIANTIHTLSWQSDICSAYRVERDPEIWSKLVGQTKQFSDNVSLVTSTEYLNTLNNNSSSSQQQQQQQQAKQTPVILSRRTDRAIRRSNLLKAAVSLLAFAFSVFRMFKTSLCDVLNYSTNSIIKFPMF